MSAFLRGITVRYLFRRLLAVLVLLSLLALSSVPTWVRAQGEPSQVIDAVFSDLSRRLGTPLTRNDANWTWDEKAFPDASLGCPQPGAAYTQAQTKGYVITITPIGSAITYDYRASLDGALIVLCSPPLDLPPTPTPIAPVNGTVILNPTALAAPVLAFINTTGDVTLTGALGGPSVAVTADAGERYELNSLYPVKNRAYGLLRWSSDGTRLLFVDHSTPSVYMVTSGGAPQLLRTGTALQLPATWTADGREAMFAVPTGQTVPNSIDAILQVQAVTGPGAAPRVVGTIRFGYGCGGGGWPASTIQYFDDAGYSGNNQLLHVLPNGILHTRGCTGVGLRLSDAAGNAIWEQAALKRPTLSPDGTRLAAIVHRSEQLDPSLPGDALVIVDLATGATTTIYSDPGKVERVGWTADGTRLVFSTRTLLRTVQGNPALALGQQLYIAWPGPFETFTLDIQAIPAQAGAAPTRIGALEGYGVGNIVTTPDSQTVILSVTESDVALVERLNAVGAQAEVDFLRPQVGLFRLKLNPAEASSNSGERGPSQPAVSNAAFVAVPANASAAAPVLAIGVQAVVSVGSNDALNMRDAPSPNAGIKRILSPGTVVTLLAGPVIDGGLRWWQVRVEPEGVIGWVVDQVTENGVTENTLTPR